MAAINDLILNKGWNCIGTCGCSVNMYKYVNTDYKGYEIRIAVNGSGQYSIRHMDISRESGKGIDQLQASYNRLFNG